MPINCPRGCHQGPGWSFSPLKHEIYSCDDGKMIEIIIADKCDVCATTVEYHEPKPWHLEYFRNLVNDAANIIRTWVMP